MSGGGGTRTETTPRDADIAPSLRPLVDKAVAGTTEAMDYISLQDFIGENIQNIPDLTLEEQKWMQEIFGWAGNPSWLEGANEGMDYTRSASELSPWEREGMDFTRRGSETDPFEQIAGLGIERGGQLSRGEQDAMDWFRADMGKGHNFGGVGARDARASTAGVNTNTRQMQRAEELAAGLTEGEIGSSPATLQAMQAWEEQMRPELLAAQALTGNLGGGSTEEALALSRTAALTPLMMKEIETREGMAQMLGQLGLGASAQELQASETNAQLGTQVSMSNADRQLQADMASLESRFRAAGMDAASAAQLASIAAGAKQREVAASGALGQLGGQRAGRKLQAGGQAAQIGGQAQGRKLQAGGQLAAIGTEKANLEISRLSKALETAGMPREIATQQAQAAYNDYLRRQGLAEQMYLGPTGNFLAGELTPGTLTESRQTGGGMFGS